MAGAKQLLELTWFNKDKALIPSEEGRYAYEWVDPKDPRYCETRTLVIDEVVTGSQSPKEEGTQYSERAELEPTDDNLLVLGESGDVLEALARVPELREKYLGKVKCIYIDPPFNTSEAFTGKDYEDNLEHSVWLTLMRDRLVHLRKMLSDDGSIWVHLDHGENHRMRVLMDGVFGSGNFVAEVVWQKSDSPRRGAGFSVDQDVIIVYRKTSSFAFNRMARTEADNARFKNPDNDPRGRWWDGDPSANHGDGRGGMCYAIQSPITGELLRPPAGGSWRLRQQTYFDELSKWTPYRYENLHDVEWRAANEGVPLEKASDEVCALVLDTDLETARSNVENRRLKDDWPMILIRSSGGIGRKTYIPETGNNPRTWWTNEEVGHNRAAKSELKALFPGRSPFSTPKPERLLERIIQIATNPGDIVLDVFAGSGTTAAVAQKMGRRWVACELSAATFETFTCPRLRKVVFDNDPGGATFTDEREPKQGVEVPGKFDTKKMEDAAKLLRAVRSEQDLSPEEETAIKTTLKLIATRPSTVRNWRGGGSFTVAHLSPQCFDYSPELNLVTLTEAATGPTLVNSVAANLNFALTPDNRHFDGKRGSMFLKIIEGRLDREKVEELLTHLGDGEGVTLAATELEPGVRQFARTTDKPCQIVHIPNDIFNYSGTQEGK